MTILRYSPYRQASATQAWKGKLVGTLADYKPRSIALVS